MKCFARLEVESGDAESVSKALDVDNVKMSGLTVSSFSVGCKVITEVCSDNLRTLINTLDDLLSCHMTAEKALKGCSIEE